MRTALSLTVERLQLRATECEVHGRRISRPTDLFTTAAVQLGSGHMTLPLPPLSLLSSPFSPPLWRVGPAAGSEAKSRCCHGL